MCHRQLGVAGAWPLWPSSHFSRRTAGVGPASEALGEPTVADPRCGPGQRRFEAIIDLVTVRSTQPRGSGSRSGRQRGLDSAYELFTSRGSRDVGVDAIVQHAGTAKMTLYRHFATKDDLVKAVLDRREELWTDRLFEEAGRRGETAGECLLAVFSVLDEWFRDPDFDGCTFITTLTGAWPDEGDLLASAAGHLERLHDRIVALALQTGAARPDQLAWHWTLLMRGAIVSAQAGHREAALLAREIASSALAAALSAPLE